MSNVLVTCSLIAKESLAILENMLGFSANVNRDWEDEFKGNQSRGYSPGATINIKRPPRYTYRAGRVAVPQSTTETTVPLTVNQGGVDLNFTGFERTLSVQQFEHEDHKHLHKHHKEMHKHHMKEVKHHEKMLKKHEKHAKKK